MLPDPVYVAPARFVLTVLHRRDPVAKGEPSGDDPAEGRTMCGRQMLSSELWRPVDGRDGDQLCGRCMPRGSGRAAVEDLEVTLW